MSEEGICQIKKIVTTEFCEKVMRKSENDPGIRVTDVTIKPATNKGDNYASEMYRATVEVVSSGNEKRREKKSIIVKVEPTTGGMKELVRVFFSRN